MPTGSQLMTHIFEQLQKEKTKKLTDVTLKICTMSKGRQLAEWGYAVLL